MSLPPSSWTGICPITRSCPRSSAPVAAALGNSVLVRIGSNVGFARANNVGARTLPGTAYLLVNNDAFVHRPGSVASLVEAMAAGNAI